MDYTAYQAPLSVEFPRQEYWSRTWILVFSFLTDCSEMFSTCIFSSPAKMQFPEGTEFTFLFQSHGIIQILFDWLNKKQKWQGSRDVLRNYLFCTNAMLSWCACRYTCVSMCVCACVCGGHVWCIYDVCTMCVMGMPCGVCTIVPALRCASKSRGQRPL